MGWELVILDSGTHVPLEVGKEYVVGSASSVHVKLSARDVSGSHAMITVYPTFVRVVDLGSKNGTFYKGKRVPVAVVANGDTVTFSSVKVQFLQTSSEPSPPPPRAFVE
ncbi:MAG: FHA domain-containing protein, partial [Thermoanaerobaculum sp.]